MESGQPPLDRGCTPVRANMHCHPRQAHQVFTTVRRSSASRTGLMGETQQMTDDESAIRQVVDSWMVATRNGN